jgi:hypothetical protein
MNVFGAFAGQYRDEQTTAARDPSNWTGVAAGAAGLQRNWGLASLRRQDHAGGTKPIRTDSGVAVEIRRRRRGDNGHDPGRDELFEAHGVKMPLGGAGGAVYTTVATPAGLVTIERADSVPKSAATPFTLMSMRSGKPDTGLPSGPIAVTFTDDCDAPSWLMLSGTALTCNDNARPDGPDSGGF